MALLSPTHHRADTTYTDYTTPFQPAGVWLLLCHGVGDGLYHVKGSVEVHSMVLPPQLMRQREERVKLTYAGVGDQAVYSCKSLESC